MAEILSEDVVEKIYRKKRKVTGIRCDKCGEIIPVYNHRECDKSIYYRVMTGHRDWGNDSCESIEHFDICPKCINAFTTEYLNNTEYDSAYIEIKRGHVVASDRWEN